MKRITPDQTFHGAGPSRRFIVVAAAFGLIPTLALIILRVVGTEVPFTAEALLAEVAFALVYLSPTMLALYASRSMPSAARVPLLFSAALLYLLASFSALSGVSLVLLPATALVGIASVRTVRAMAKGLAWKSLSVLGAVGASALVAAAFLLLFLDDDPRCWQLTKYADGRTEWRAMPVPSSGQGTFRAIPIPVAGENVVRQEARCTGDVITRWEALASLGLLVVAFLPLAGLSRYLGQAAQREVP